MGYANLEQCIADMEKHGDLRRIDYPFDPNLEIAYIQRRAFAARSPALLFTQPKGCSFPMLANLYGTRERVNFIFRDALKRAKAIFELRANMAAALKNPLKAAANLPALWHMRPRKVAPANAPVLANACSLTDLPKLVSWPQDGGPFITLPLVYSEDPAEPFSPNLGMYRIQLAGNEYAEDEIGLHYQLQRGIGIHHARALAKGQKLAVTVHAGGPPALAVSAVMPLPEGMSELIFAGLLGGRRMEIARTGQACVLAQADFALQCELGPELRPEGPFGDHLGYYSLKHDFPMLRVKKITHRPGAVWPFTSVGRPPQEDTVFGDLIHELTGPMVSNVFPGVQAVHAVDRAGVHPLLLAVGSERYTPYESEPSPREIITQAMHLLGTTQTALAKFVIIAAQTGVSTPDCHDVPGFLQYVLTRTDFATDLRFIGRSACDTLDYSGYGLHAGSRLIWTAARKPQRKLGNELVGLPDLPQGFTNPRLIMPGVMVIEGQPHKGGPLQQDQRLFALLSVLAAWRLRESFPLVALTDDTAFCSASLDNFLWTIFTRADPVRDCYGVNETVHLKHWSCEAPLLIDGRLKEFQARPLEDDPHVVKRIESLAVKGAPLAGLI